MSEENKTVELNDEELKQVSGGARFYLYEVSVGDVFLLNDNTAFIVKSNVTANGNNPYVPLVMADLIGNTWQKNSDTGISMNSLSNCTYSKALTGTLNHLLN